MEFAHKHVLITGGSRGLGRALGLALAGAGARVSLVARRAGALATTVAEIERLGGQAHAIAADVADKHAVHAIVGEAAALFGPVDVLIQAASTLGPTPLRTLLDSECEDLTRVLEVNLVGPFRIAKAVAGQMLIRGAGTVLTISSDAAINTYPTWGPYGASKAALDHLTATLAAELADSGVRFVSIDPGEMDTDMHAAAMPHADRGALRSPTTVARQIVAWLARPGSAPEVTRFIVEPAGVRADASAPEQKEAAP